jgi:hypothetical protein
MPPGVDVPRGAGFWTPSVPIIVTGTPPNTGNLDTFGVFWSWPIAARTRYVGPSRGFPRGSRRASIEPPP